MTDDEITAGMIEERDLIAECDRRAAELRLLPLGDINLDDFLVIHDWRKYAWANRKPLGPPIPTSEMAERLLRIKAKIMGW